MPRSPPSAPRSSSPRPAPRRRAQLGELKARLERDPKDHQARLDLATALFAAGEREAAIDQLLDIIRRDREWNEEAARKQLLKFFEAIGLRRSADGRGAPAPLLDPVLLMPGAFDPDFADLPTRLAGLSADRRAAAAARPAAAQHLRAALSRDDPPCARQRPDDRHDPAAGRRGRRRATRRSTAPAAPAASSSSARPRTAAISSLLKGCARFDVTAEPPREALFRMVVPDWRRYEAISPTTKPELDARPADGGAQALFPAPRHRGRSRARSPARRRGASSIRWRCCARSRRARSRRCSRRRTRRRAASC